MGLFDKVMSGADKIKSAAEAALGTASDSRKDTTVNISGTPETLDELKAAVDVKDPASVAAYFVYSVMALTADFDIGIGMMKYLFADIEPFGRGFVEGGTAGRAGWDSYFSERLKDDEYRWLPRAYFNGASASNGFQPTQPLSIDLHYNATNTESINAQTLQQLGRENVVYWVQSNAAGYRNNITVSRFEGTDRWYVTSGTTSSGLFYDQRSALTDEAKAKLYT